MPEQIKGFMSTVESPTDWQTLCLNLLAAAILSLILERFYIRFGRSLSNRRAFAANFIYLALTTMLVISVVKSSIALSLGLVGALSIVRFRAAIKEPEELAFLFLAIAIGLGAGANQVLLTAASVACVLLIVAAKEGRRASAALKPCLYLTISRNDRNLDAAAVIGILREHCESVDLQRSEESDDRFDLGFVVQYGSEEKFLASRADLLKLDPSISISFVDLAGA